MWSLVCRDIRLPYLNINVNVVRPFPVAIKSRLNRIKFRVPKIAIVTGKPESFKKIISNYKRMAKYRYRGV